METGTRRAADDWCQGYDAAAADDAKEFARLEARIADLEDLARNVGGFDDGLLHSADLNLLRATLREFRDEARKLLDVK
jgi:hypothetical protein